MKAEILSLNSGAPTTMIWQDQSVVSSMLRHPVPGPLVVHQDHIEGNSFSAPTVHGLSHSVLYAYGIKSALVYMKLLGLNQYDPGALGENVTLDDLDESQISVGDIFEFGEVVAQASYPRIPCSKLNIRMQHPEGQKLMQQSGRSGIYFRILKPGKIYKTDSVRRTELAKYRFLISDLYQKTVNGIRLNKNEIELALKNGAFPQKAIEKMMVILNQS